MPEALWFHYQFDVENPYRWMMRKLERRFRRLMWLRGGNRKLSTCVGGDGVPRRDGSVTVEVSMRLW